MDSRHSAWQAPSLFFLAFWALRKVMAVHEKHPRVKVLGLRAHGLVRLGSAGVGTVGFGGPNLGPRTQGLGFRV